jgi:hypothetical protein
MNIFNKLEKRNLNFTNNFTNKKGQIVVYDFMFGFITFLVIITIITLLWFQNYARVIQENEQEMKLKMAYDISAILSQTSGNPPRWELNESFYLVENFTLGFAIDYNVLCPMKIEAFKNITNNRDDDDINELLNIPSYNYQIRLRDVDNRIILNIGQDQGFNISGTVSRKVFLNNEVVTMEVTIY